MGAKTGAGHGARPRESVHSPPPRHPFQPEFHAPTPLMAAQPCHVPLVQLLIPPPAHHTIPLAQRQQCCTREPVVVGGDVVELIVLDEGVVDVVDIVHLVDRG